MIQICPVNCRFSFVIMIPYRLRDNVTKVFCKYVKSEIDELGCGYIMCCREKGVVFF